MPAQARKSRSASLTPMLKHYLSVKEEYPDAILLYRMGDFYELFFEDAVRAAPLLEVALTARQKGTPSEAPMCGVPHHAIDGYIAKLVRHGEKVAICDQVEDPAQAKGLVRREVTRVITPGTLSELELLDSNRPNRLAVVIGDMDALGGAFLEVSTGELLVSDWRDAADALREMALLEPKEALVAEDVAEELRSLLVREGIPQSPIPTVPDPQRATEELSRHLGVESLRGFGFTGKELGLIAAAIALDYARSMALSDLQHVRTIKRRQPDDVVQLDEATVRNLEILRNANDGGARGTLLSVVDRTVTAPGARCLRDWLTAPLRDRHRLEARHDAVAELLEHGGSRRRLTELLRGVADLRRLATRAVLGRLKPREAAALRDSLLVIPEIQGTLDDVSSARALDEIRRAPTAEELARQLETTLATEPSVQVNDGGVIADGVSDELDRARSLAQGGREHVLALQERERERTGVGSLKVRYNRVFGYFIEVSKSQQDRIPEEYVRKQTLANAERYFTPELKELEESILGAEQEQVAIETRWFEELTQSVAAHSKVLGEAADALAQLDVLLSFAEVAGRFDYCRPRLLSEPGRIEIEEGRHPVVERTVHADFVPNDTSLDAESAQIALLTGPNMGGKSTYLRQVALLTVLAHSGSFVPAKSAELGAVDRIFTRVGASDNLARGESTFMVEMIETANILNSATRESLVILDEVGRGTSTFDGLSLAWAIVERLHDREGPLTLFATHYHELTELVSVLDRLVNLTLSVKRWQGEILFLHRVVPGCADQSYGLHVAKLAGVPQDVLDRAAKVLANLEAQEFDFRGRPRRGSGSPPAGPDQLTLFTGMEEVVAEVLRDVDLDRLTPLAALNLISTLKERLGDAPRTELPESRDVESGAAPHAVPPERDTDAHEKSGARDLDLET